MSARVERTTPVRYIKPQEVVVNFDPVRLKAPFLLRCGAILIDYIILIAIPVICLLIYRSSGSDQSKILNNEIMNIGWLIVVLLAVTNFVLLPLLIGQSVGKMLTGLKVVKKDGTSPSLGRLCLRHLLGYPLTILTLGLGFFFAALNKRGRALHDYIAGTVVIYGRKTTMRQSDDETLGQSDDTAS
jgi:uncharacterized RDD family membrane protein YckC